MNTRRQLSKRARAVASTILFVHALIGTGAVAAAESQSSALTGAGSSVSWSGVFENLATPAPEACTERTCDEVNMEVRLESNVWQRPGGMLVAVDSPKRGLDPDVDVDLYVYGPDGTLRGKASGLSQSKAVLVRSPENGTYRVVVVPTTAVGHIVYRGYAGIEFDPPAQPARDLVPNLVALAPETIQISSGVPGLDLGLSGPASCQPQETAEFGARRCLRFDQGIANFGQGPIELWSRNETIDPTMRQRIYRSDGSTWDRVAGGVEFHPSHAHFHYAEFAQAFLYAAERAGTKGQLLRTGRKQGFCLADVRIPRFGERGLAPTTYDLPGVCDGSQRDEEGFYSRAGISAGWADVYPWQVPDQYIEVSGIPNGRYVFELVINGARALLESTYEDNSVAVLIEITDGDVVRIL